MKNLESRIKDSPKIEWADSERAVARHFATSSAKWGQHYCGAPEDIAEFDLQTRRAAALSFLDRTRGERQSRLSILDVGCGSGNVLSGVDAAQWNVLGVDFVEGMICESQRTLPHARLAVADAANIPFPSASIDVVTCLGVLEYIPQWDAVLDSIHSVLKPGGHLIVSFPNGRSMFRRLGRLEAGVLRNVRALSALTRQRSTNSRSAEYTRHEWTPDEAIVSVQNAGFHIRDARFMTYGLKGRIGDRLAINLAVAKWMDGRLTTNTLLSRSLAWTMVTWCTKPTSPR